MSGTGAGIENGDGSNRQGRALAALLEFPDLWINRRVEQIRFVDGETVRRSVSVDFQLPRWYPTTAGKDVPVPLAMLAKRPLVSFDLRDESEASLPLLSSAKANPIAVTALLGAAEVALQRTDHRIDERLEDDLRSLAGCAPAEAGSRIEALFDAAGRPERLVLRRDERMFKLANELSWNFLLLTPVSGAGGRRIIKFSYEERRPRPKDATLRARFGLQPIQLRWLTPGASMAASYHCEVEAPRGLTVAGADLIAVDGTEKPVAEASTDQAVAKQHLYLPGVPSNANAVLNARVRPSCSQLLTAMFLLALAISALLVSGIAFRDAVTEASDSAAAILISIPALLAVYLSRPDEHELLAELLTGIRGLSVVTGCVAFAAAATLVGGISAPALLWTWLGLATMSALSTVLLGLSALRSRA